MQFNNFIIHEIGKIKKKFPLHIMNRFYADVFRKQLPNKKLKDFVSEQHYQIKGEWYSNATCNLHFVINSDHTSMVEL